MLISGRKPTHEPMDLNDQWDLSDAIEEAAPDQRVSHQLMVQVAEAQGVPVSHVYIGAVIDPMLQWEREGDLTIHVCLGACQAFGASEALEALIAARAARVSEGKAVFDIIPRGCLSACERGPALASNGAHGQAVHPNVNAEGVAEILEVLLDD